jgi:hypothetical protein
MVVAGLRQHPSQHGGEERRRVVRRYRSAGVGWACVWRYAVVSLRDMTVPYLACMSRRLTL